MIYFLRMAPFMPTARTLKEGKLRDQLLKIVGRARFHLITMYMGGRLVRIPKNSESFYERYARRGDFLDAQPGRVAAKILHCTEKTICTIRRKRKKEAADAAAAAPKIDDTTDGTHV